MDKVRDAIDSTVSISLLNKGYAGQIFDEVRSSGTKVVMKNNSPECVLVSPDSYRAMLDEINELRAACAGLLRLQDVNPKDLLTDEDFYTKADADPNSELMGGVIIE